MLNVEKTLKNNLKAYSEENKALLGNYYFQYYEDFPNLIEKIKLHVYYMEKSMIVDSYYDMATTLQGYADQNKHDVYEIRKVLE